MHHPDALGAAIILLAATVLCVPLLKRFGMASVLGYLLAGSLIGPWGLGWLSDVENIMHVAEIGVVLLLFVIGLELQPSRLWGIRRAVFWIGSLQVVITSLVLAVLAYTVGHYSVAASVVLGLSLSLSSTAFAMQMLTESDQVNTAFGRSAFAILLFQDLVAIPLLVLIPLLSFQKNLGSILDTSSVLKVLLALVGLFLIHRFLLRPLFRVVAAAHTREIFTALALLVVLGTAWVMQWVGLSMAFGAFLAGVLLSESEYRHELEADIEPFKGLLLGLFFISIGMSVDYGLVWQKLPLVLGLLAGYTIIKVGAIYFLLRRADHQNSGVARDTSVLISQGGEFGFVLMGAAVANRLLDANTAGIVTALITLSMALTPVLTSLSRRHSRKVDNPQKPFDTMRDEGHPVIIAGFGRVGQIAGRMLRLHGIGFTALEHDYDQVDVVRRFGTQIYYGDASREDLLEAAGAAKARFFVLAVDDVEASIRIARTVLERFPNLKILARARNRQHTYELLDLGIEVIHRETFDSSVNLARDLMLGLGFAPSRLDTAIAEFKRMDWETLLKQHRVRDDESKLISVSKQGAEQLSQVLSADQSQISKPS